MTTAHKGLHVYLVNTSGRNFYLDAEVANAIGIDLDGRKQCVLKLRKLPRKVVSISFDKIFKR